MPGSRNWLDIGKKAAKEFMSDDVTGLAAELSYRYFLALFPFAIFLAALGGFIAHMTGAQDPTSQIMKLVGNSLPSDARSVIQGEVHSVVTSRNGGLLSIGILGAIWASSSAMKTLIKALDRAYDVPETRPWWKQTGLAIVMTVAVAIGIVGSIVILIATTAWADKIATSFGFGSAFKVAITWARWPAVVALMLLAVATLYWAAPNYQVRFRFLTPGAVVFVVVWIAATIGFGFYVTNFSSYNKTYGALGGVVVLLVWLYLTNIVLLFGAELNALLDMAEEPARARQERVRLLERASTTGQKQSMEPSLKQERQKPGARAAGQNLGQQQSQARSSSTGDGHPAHGWTLARAGGFGAALGAVFGRHRPHH